MGVEKGVGKEGMYGKHFGSMYTGSMVGSGAIVFAVWGYVIANMRPDRRVGFQVELNPRLLAAILGEEEVEVVKAIGVLCGPDKESRSKEDGGRRLRRVGQFEYLVVNAAKYAGIRNEEMRREQNREAQQRRRERLRGDVELPKGPPKTMEERLMEQGQVEVGVSQISAGEVEEGRVRR